MFLFGLVDNCCTTYICIALGFEFTSKIVPFGTKNLVENISAFLFFLLFSLWSYDSQDGYRIIFSVYIILGLIGGILMLVISSRFKQKS